MKSPPRALVDALDELEPRERLISLYACQRVWPILRNDSEWHSRIDQTYLAMNLTPREHEEIMAHAGRVARALREELTP